MIPWAVAICPVFTALRITAMCYVHCFSVYTASDRCLFMQNLLYWRIYLVLLTKQLVFLLLMHQYYYLPLINNVYLTVFGSIWVKRRKTDTARLPRFCYWIQFFKPVLAQLLGPLWCKILYYVCFYATIVNFCACFCALLKGQCTPDVPDS